MPNQVARPRKCALDYRADNRGDIYVYIRPYAEIRRDGILRSLLYASSAAYFHCRNPKCEIKWKKNSPRRIMIINSISAPNAGVRVASIPFVVLSVRITRRFRLNGETRRIQSHFTATDFRIPHTGTHTSVYTQVQTPRCSHNTVCT